MSRTPAPQLPPPMPTRSAVVGTACRHLAILLAVLAFEGATSNPAHAAWPSANLQVSPNVLSRARSVSVADGTGGVIVAFEEDYRGNVELYVQRLNSTGSRQWGSNGIAICTAAGNQRFPAITSDGAGGAIIAWQDPRGGVSDIYAQRVSAGGNVQWTANGVALCTAVNSQSFPVLATDGSGGAIVAWSDGRSGAGQDVYARRVNSAGVPQWIADGVAICNAATNQSSVAIISDGVGGAIMAWQDPRLGTNDIYAQRVTGAGAALWIANGLALCTAVDSQEGPSLASDGSNGAIVAWRDFRSGTNYDTYAQRVTSTGFIDWAANGVALCTATGDQGYPTVVSDGSSGVVVTWDDGRGTDLDIYAQRINGFGSPQWSANGVAVSSAGGTQTAPRAIQDGSGGAILIWSDLRKGSDYDLYAGRISGAGVPQWTADGVALCTVPGNDVGPDIVIDGFGGAIAAWDDNRTPASDVYARRIDSSGTPTWTADGVSLCTSLDDQLNQAAVPDGAGGTIIVWEELVRGIADLYAQRVSGDGVLQWATNGVAVCAAPGSQYFPVAVPDGAGGAIVAWHDDRSDAADVYAQRISAAGVIQWISTGVALSTAAQFQYFPVIVSDGAGGAIVAWTDTRNGNYDIYARRITSAGVPQWTVDGVAMCAATGDQYSPSIDTDGAGGAILSWQDYRGGTTADIYARRVTSAGVPQWLLNGVALCTAAFDQVSPKLVTDGSGGAIVTWQDQRIDGHVADIYARRITGTGVPQWAADGVGVCVDANHHVRPTIISDQAGGAVIAWVDLRSGVSSDVYAERINGAGTSLWTANGVALCSDPKEQGIPVLVSDGASGAIAVWEDLRFNGFDEDVFTRRITAAGAPQAPIDGAAVTAAPSRQVGVELVSDAAGGAVVVWQDFRSGTNWDIYAHRIIPSGPVSVPVVQSVGRLWLGPAFPNPTPAMAAFRFRLPDRTSVSLAIYDLQGRRVRGLIEATLESGERSASWDGRDESGQVAPSGIYLCRLEAAGENQSTKVVKFR